MQVGFAIADITPPLGTEVPGGLNKRYSVSVHDPLYASAVVIAQGESRVALVGLDALSVRGFTVREAREMIQARCGIPGENVLVGCSHTHNGGPTCGALPGEFSRAWDPDLCESLAQGHATSASPEYCREVAGQIATAVAVADQRKREALLAAGRGQEATVAFNRRFKMRDGTQMTHPGKGNPEILDWAGPADPEVGVLSAWTPEGELLGAVVNFTLHGTVYGGGTSSDWIHYLRETVRAVYAGAGVVFLNGACGDVTQVNNLSLQESEFGEKWARRIGQKVGAEALKVLADAEPGEMESVAAASTRLALKTREVSEERFRTALGHVTSDAPRDTVDYIFARDEVLLHEHNKWEPAAPCEVQAIQVGPVAYVANPAEYFCQFGLDIKSRSRFPYTWVVELANGCVGYVPTPEALGPAGGGYEPRLAMSSKLAPEAGGLIADASVGLLETLTPGAEPPRPTVPQAGQPWNIGSSRAEKV